MDALSCIVVIALMVPARTHLRIVTIAPRRHIRLVLRRPLVAVAYWSWHVVLLGNAAHVQLMPMRYFERAGRVVAPQGGGHWGGLAYSVGEGGDAHCPDTCRNQSIL